MPNTMKLPELTTTPNLDAAGRLSRVAWIRRLCRDPWIATGVLAVTAAAQVVTPPPVPQWIHAGATAPGAGPARMEREFVPPPGLLKGILLATASADSEFLVNGIAAGRMGASTNAMTWDVTSRLRPGTNVVSVVTGGRVAVLFELNAGTHRQEWILSDGRWSVIAADGGRGPVAVAGRVDRDGSANPFDPGRLIDAYNSWKLAKAGTVATPASELSVLPGFTVERVRSSRGDEGSWIAMAFDPEGRLTLAREKRGLLRLRFAGDWKAGGAGSDAGPGASGMGETDWEAAVEVVDDTLLECRGLLYAHGALYANANNAHTLFRLRDPGGTGRFTERVELLRTGGGVGHGRNHVRLGPDGMIYVAHGNNVLLATNVSNPSPVRGVAEDQLIPCPWDPGMFDGDVVLPAGHLLRLAPDGGAPELFACGFRNPLDIAFNGAGELFTFDADMEWDLGTPWYMPNRVLHVIPGADFGWRRGTGRFPADYPETLGSVVDVGLASPTAVLFGTGSRFPSAYQRVLYICDWAYGRILAVHLQPAGASYVGSTETFVAGRPLNVTDACMGPDGAFWFVTGGRGTQSGLYRIRHRDAASLEPLKPDESTMTPEARLRRRFERRRIENGRSVSPERVDEIWEGLGHRDRSVRYAARLALECVPTGEWERRALREGDPARAVGALLALARQSGPEERGGGGMSREPLRAAMVRRLLAIAGAAGGGDEARQLEVLRVLAVVWVRLGAPGPDERSLALEWLGSRYPGSRRLNPELCRLLVYLGSPEVVARTMPLVASATTPEELLVYPFLLRYAKEGWTAAWRRGCFEALRRAEGLQGGRNYFEAIRRIRRELLAGMPEEERRSLAAITSEASMPAEAASTPASFVKAWTLADLEGVLPRAGRGRSHGRAVAAVRKAQCGLCHRVSQDPALPAGTVGPDLMGVAARFGRADLVRHILEPSAVIDEKYRLTRLTLDDGTELTGVVEQEDLEKLVLRPGYLESGAVEVPRRRIRERGYSLLSPMPGGLLDGLAEEEILDLLAYFEASGDPSHPVFRP